jgi:hypothetical protein
MGEIRRGGIEDAGGIACVGLALVIHRCKAAKDHTECEAQVIGGVLGVKFFDVFWKRSTFRAINGLLGPVLCVAPGRRSWSAETDRDLASFLMHRKESFNPRENLRRIINSKNRKPIYVAYFESNFGV